MTNEKYVLEDIRNYLKEYENQNKASEDSELYKNLMRILNSAEEQTTYKKIDELWQKIRSGHIKNSNHIADIFSSLTEHFDIYYQLTIIQRDKITEDFDFTDMISEIKSLLPNALVFENNVDPEQEIIILRFYPKQPFSSFEKFDELHALLKKNSLHGMISNATRDYGFLNQLYELCSRANILSYVIHRNQFASLNFAERYNMYVLLDLSARHYIETYKSSDILYVAHPLIVHLSRYDERHGTNLRDVLYYYLLNNRDLKTTAEQLYMHRNTVLNKLNLIKSICPPIDFDNGGQNQRLLFSCQLALYYERVMLQSLTTDR